MRLVDKASDRMILQETGKTTNGHPFILMVISSADNLRNIERYKQVNRRIHDPRTVASEEEAKKLVREGKTVHPHHLQHAFLRGRGHPDVGRGGP